MERNAGSRAGLKRLMGILFLAALVSFLAAGRASAQQPTPSDDEVNAIARQLYCPVCQNTPLDVCPTEACRQWRELIRQMLQEGKTPNEIKQYFVDNYGIRVLNEPPAAGFNGLIYVLPVAAFIAGLVLLVVGFRTWRNAAKTDQTVENPAPSSGRKKPRKSGEEKEYAARLEEELRKRQ